MTPARRQGLKRVSALVLKADNDNRLAAGFRSAVTPRACRNHLNISGQVTFLGSPSPQAPVQSPGTDGMAEKLAFPAVLA
jgi:hypothetical protein